MTVAIAFERYIAVHYPLDYNQVRRHLQTFGELKCPLAGKYLLQQHIQLHFFFCLSYISL